MVYHFFQSEWVFSLPSIHVHVRLSFVWLLELFQSDFERRVNTGDKNK